MSKNTRRNYQAAQGPAQTPKPSEAVHAPWPMVDRYPVVLGSNLTLTYIASVYRLCQSGYRREYVDVLDELLERDPELYNDLSTRILTVAGGRIECVPPECDESEKELAATIAAEFKQDLMRIARLRQSLAALQWGIYYGVSASEISWTTDVRTRPVALHWIHSRRLAFPDPNSWDVRLWDAGPVTTWGFLEGSTIGYGLRLADHWAKFIIHMPQLRGDYPTRDGLGRETSIWVALKLMGARGAGQYIERFGKPWVDGEYATSDDGKPRAFDQADKASVESLLTGLGAGSTSGGLHPDSVKVTLMGPGAQGGAARKLAHGEFVEMCNKEIRKVVLGATDMVEAGENGARSAVSERRKNATSAYRYDAGCLSDTLFEYLSQPWTTLNHPGLEHLAPYPAIFVDEEPEPNEIMERAATAAGVGLPIDADKLAAKIGLDDVLIDAKATEGRRLLPVKPIDDIGFLEVGYEPPPPPEPVVAAPPKPGEKPQTKAPKDSNKD